jgi:hypothetical protein
MTVQRPPKHMLHSDHHDRDLVRQSPILISPTRPSDLRTDPLIQLFYQHFYPAHPFLPPLDALRSSIQDRLPSHVVAAMRYVGAQFYPEPLDLPDFKHAAYVALSDCVPADGYRVQSLLLLALVFQGRGHDERACHTLRAAVELALALGMHESRFASQHAHDSHVLKEMWRRTYWELYVVETAITPHSVLFHTHSDVPLPGDDENYNDGVDVRSIHLYPSVV